MKKLYFLFTLLLTFNGFGQNVTITKIIETPCGTPFLKIVELYVDGTVNFTSDVKINNMNGGGAWNNNIDASALGEVTDKFVYLTTDLTLMVAEFPNTVFDSSNHVACFTTSNATNGDDGFQVVLNEVIVSQFGKNGIDADNDSPSWKHRDAVAARKTGLIDVGAWDYSHWDITAENVLDTNSACKVAGTTIEGYLATLGEPFPLGSGSGWTPDAATCTTSLGITTSSCITTTDGAANDTYTASLDFSGGDNGNTFVVSSTLGTVGGDDPSSVATGTITITGIAEGTDITVSVSDTGAGGVCDLSAAIDSPSCIPLLINEVLYDPASDIPGDANGDGTRSSSEDEFIEFYNNSSAPLDISGYTISDGQELRHTFPASTSIPANKMLVVFGGGTPTGSFGGSAVQVASGTSGQLNLNNAGDIITVKNVSGAVVLIYKSSDTGISHGSNQSVTRSPDFTGSFVLHSDANASLLFSPGTLLDGTALSVNTFSIDELSIFPNPVNKGSSFLNIVSNSSESISVVILDILGKQLKRQTVTNNKIDISNLGSGIYLLKIAQDNKHITRKIIIE